jgi:DNA topoisomerase-1
VGDVFKVVDALVEERETEPPPYLSESDLLRLMRKYGIGTDATMQDHIHTNVVRRYFMIRGKQCIPTPLGKALISALGNTVGELVDPWFRSRMEKMLMEIGRNSRKPQEVLDEFRRETQRNFEKLNAKNDMIAAQLIKAIRKNDTE